jgi:hypothetical protein
MILQTILSTLASDLELLVQLYSAPTKANFLAIAKAMAISENGADALLIPDSDWNEGWRLATQRADIKSYVK